MAHTVQQRRMNTGLNISCLNSIVGHGEGHSEGLIWRNNQHKDDHIFRKSTSLKKKQTGENEPPQSRSCVQTLYDPLLA